MMSSNITGPIKLMLAVLMGTGIIIVIMVVFANSINNAPVSTQIVSSNTVLTNLLPWLGAMVAGGLFMTAWGSRR